ncbi:MAG TPA: TIGR02300 family protein [Stellaceae bacterium]|nr:TIGR02300 family protein [Stellaceae bacterium]
MVKAEWGTKRTCPNCGTRYYDLHHDPIICPKCGAAFDVEAVLKTRRVRVAAPVEVPEPVVEEEIDAGLEPEGGAEAEEEEAEPAAAEGEEEEEEEEVIEDASELGEDQDDMAEVIENVEDDEER